MAKYYIKIENIEVSCDDPVHFIEICKAIWPTIFNINLRWVSDRLMDMATK